MADRLVTIRKLLTHESSDRRSAAAIVLAELGVDDKRSVKALVEALVDDDSRVQRYVLEALGQARASTAVEQMVEFIGSSDPAVREAAERAVMQIGEEGVPALRLLLQGSAKVRRLAAHVLSRLESDSGIEMLVDSVTGADAAVLDRARHALRGRAGDLDAATLRGLRRRLDQRLSEARHRHDHTLAAALLQLLGDLPDHTVVTRIVQEIGPETPPTVRRAALQAMLPTLPLARGQRREAAVGRLLDCLIESPGETVTRPALRALQAVELSERFTPQLRELVEAPEAAVRAYALRELGRQGATDSIATLVQQLAEGSAPVREAAHQTLRTMPHAATAVADTMLQVTDPRRLHELGELLQVHRETLPQADAQHLVVTVLDRVEAGEGTALADTVAQCLPEPFMEEVRGRVLRRRRGKKLAEAHALLKALKDNPSFGEEEQYQLALLGLLSQRKPSGRPPRVTDQVCQPFARLLNGGFAIDLRLRKERLVQFDDLLYLAFAFVESHDEDERDFGEELLEEVAQRDPGGKSGARAKNKLKLLGR